MRKLLSALLLAGTATVPAAFQSTAPVKEVAPKGDPSRAEFLNRFARSYYPGRSGQIMIVPREGDIITRDEPDIRYMHGSPWPYDSAIPMFFAGKAVRAGSYSTPAIQQDVAVTIASIVQATMPPTVTGRVLPIAQPGARPPRAVLVVVLDGMRPDYFSRYAKEMPALSAARSRSASFPAAHVNTMPTNTAVGHATIATGTDPGVHGITGNNLYDRTRKARHDMFTGWNPKDLAVASLADVWQLQTAGRAIVVAQGSSMQASVALAGHGACQLNGTKTTHAGYDERSGKWGTNADCFMQPASVGELDARSLWPADGLWMGQNIATPSAVRRSGLFPQFEADAFTRMIESQPIGQDDVTDLLLLNYKGADYVGHKHGPESRELAATLAEMDRHLSRILRLVDERTGGDYLLAVTADHGMPSEPAGGDARRHFAPQIVGALHQKFDPDGRTLISYYEPENAQIFVDRDRLASLKLTLDELTAFLQSQAYIFAAFTEEEVRRARNP